MLVVFKSSEKPKGFGLCILFLLGLNRIKTQRFWFVYSFPFGIEQKINSIV
jgi:hypothetical protein